MASPACIFRDHMKLDESTDETQAMLDEAYEEGTWKMGPPLRPEADAEV